MGAFSREIQIEESVENLLLVLYYENSLRSKKTNQKCQMYIEHNISILIPATWLGWRMEDGDKCLLGGGTYSSETSQ